MGISDDDLGTIMHEREKAIEREFLTHGTPKDKENYRKVRVCRAWRVYMWTRDSAHTSPRLSGHCCRSAPARGATARRWRCSWSTHVRSTQRTLVF